MKAFPIRFLPLLSLVMSLAFVTGTAVAAQSATDARWYQIRAEQRKQMEAVRKGMRAEREARAKKTTDGIIALIDEAAKARCATQDADLHLLAEGMKRLDADSAADLATRIKALPPAPATSDPKVESAWRHTFKLKREELLKPTKDLMLKAQRLGVPDVVHGCIRQYLGFWPDCDSLLTGMGRTRVRDDWYGPRSALLAKAGATWDMKLGWISDKDQARYQKGDYYDLQTRAWTTLDEANKLHADPAKPWKLQTEHLELQGTAPLQLLVAAANRLELFHDQIFAAYANFFVGGRNGASNNDLRTILGIGNFPRLSMTIFKDEKQYHAGVPEAPGWSAGLFNPGKGSSYFFAHGDRIHFGVMYHEFTHQVLHMYTSRNAAPVWLVEGIAVYTETPAWEHGDMLLGRLASSGRMLNWSREFAAGKALPLSNLMRLDHESWSKSKNPDPNYKAAGALTYFCMEADDRRYRADFVDFLRDSYRGAAEAHPLWDYLGMSREELTTAFEAWAKEQATVKPVPPGDPLGDKD